MHKAEIHVIRIATLFTGNAKNEVSPAGIGHWKQRGKHYPIF